MGSLKKQRLRKKKTKKKDLEQIFKEKVESAAEAFSSVIGVLMKLDPRHPLLKWADLLVNKTITPDEQIEFNNRYWQREEPWENAPELKVFIVTTLNYTKAMTAAVTEITETTNTLH